MRELEYGTDVMSAAIVGRAVHLTFGSEDQSSQGIRPGKPCEVKQSRIRPFPAGFARQFEQRPGVLNAAIGGSAVEIAGSIEDQASCGAGIVQHLFLPAPARFRR